MARPEAVVESSSEAMTEAAWAFLEPTRLVFPNGATVIYNVTDITDGDVSFGGRSLGGSSLLADADVVDAVLAGEVVTSSGVGDLGPVDARPVPRRHRRLRDREPSAPTRRA